MEIEKIVTNPSKEFCQNILSQYEQEETEFSQFKYDQFCQQFGQGCLWWGEIKHFLGRVMNTVNTRTQIEFLCHGKETAKKYSLWRMPQIRVCLNQHGLKVFPEQYREERDKLINSNASLRLKIDNIDPMTVEKLNKEKYEKEWKKTQERIASIYRTITEEMHSDINKTEEILKKDLKILDKKISKLGGTCNLAEDKKIAGKKRKEEL